MAHTFIDELHGYLEHDEKTAMWLFPLEPLLHSSYNHRFCTCENVSYFLVYDDAFDTGEYWLSALAFYKRSKEIARALITKGYYGALHDDEVEDDVQPTGA